MLVVVRNAFVFTEEFSHVNIIVLEDFIYRLVIIRTLPLLFGLREAVALVSYAVMLQSRKHFVVYKLNY